MTTSNENTFTIPLTREAFKSLNTYLFEIGKVTAPDIQSNQFFSLEHKTPLGTVAATCRWDAESGLVYIQLTKRPLMASLAMVRERVIGLVTEWVKQGPSERQEQ